MAARVAHIVRLQCPLFLLSLHVKITETKGPAEEFGGAGFDATAACIVHEELSAAGE